MRKILAIGSSHLNSMKLSEDYAKERFGIEVSFSYSSVEAWDSIPVSTDGGVLQFVVDPQEYFSRHAPVPVFVRQLEQGLQLGTFDEIVVGHVGTTYGGVSFFFQNRLPGATELLNRNPVTKQLFSELVDPANCVPPPRLKLSWTVKPHQTSYSFSLRMLLRQVAEIGRSARLSYIPTHPPFASPDATNSQVDLYRVAYNDYLEVIKEICNEFGFVVVMPPVQARDQTGVFTNLKFSVNPERRDSHLNAEYGRMLWDALLI